MTVLMTPQKGICRTPSRRPASAATACGPNDNGSRPDGPAGEDNGGSHVLAREAAFSFRREDAF